MEPLQENVPEIVQCPGCGTRNRIPPERPASQARCGKCGTLLKAHEQPVKGPEFYLFRCPECRARNRLIADKLNAGPVCGKCKKPLRTEELFLDQPLVITDTNFESLVLKSPLPVLLFAWAPWCPTCSAFLPVIDNFGRESKGRVRVGKVNVDQSPGISSRFSILSVPQILIIDGGDLRETLPGAMQKHEIMMKMARYL
jgi:thioredoxin 2